MTDKDDIVDEAINFFRANVLFANFTPEGAADKTLIYLTLFIHKVLVTCVRIKTKSAGTKRKAQQSTAAAVCRYSS